MCIRDSYAHRLPVRTPRYFGADYDPGSSGQPGPRLAAFVDALPVGVKIWISRNTRKYLRPTKRRYALLIEDMGSAGANLATRLSGMPSAPASRSRRTRTVRPVIPTPPESSGSIRNPPTAPSVPAARNVVVTHSGVSSSGAFGMNAARFAGTPRG